MKNRECRLHENFLQGCATLNNANKTKATIRSGLNVFIDQFGIGIMIKFKRHRLPPLESNSDSLQDTIRKEVIVFDARSRRASVEKV